MHAPEPGFSPTRRRVLARAVGLAVAGACPWRGIGAAEGPGVTRDTELAALFRTLFPHDFLGDDAYRAVVQKLAARLATDPKLGTVIDAGLAALPAGFAAQDQPEREQVLAPHAGTPFFKLLRQAAAGTLYYLPETWKALGYPGPSAPFGGYVDQNLVSLDWLPEAHA